MPDKTIATVLLYTIINGFHGIDLVRAHHQQFLLRFHQHHVLADHFAQCALFQEAFGKIFQMLDFVVLLICQMVNGQELLIRIELEMLLFIVGEIDGIGTVAHNEQLHVAHQRIAITIARFVFIIHDLLHGFSW